MEKPFWMGEPEKAGLFARELDDRTAAGIYSEV